jgi:hypothetical protein
MSALAPPKIRWSKSSAPLKDLVKKIEEWSATNQSM